MLCMLAHLRGLAIATEWAGEQTDRPRIESLELGRSGDGQICQPAVFLISP